MPVTVNESYVSRSRVEENGSTRLVLIYTIQDAADDEEAMSALVATAPSTFRDKPMLSKRVEEQGGGLWRGEVEYGEAGTGSDAILPPDGTKEFEFDTIGENTRITQALAEVGIYGEDVLTNGAINLEWNRGEPRVHGVDIVVPKFDWNVRVIDANISDTYKMTVANMTGRVNNAAWTHQGHEFQKGEVLFRGAHGRRRGSEKWDITYSFSYSPNRSNFTVGGINVDSAEGWHYVWVYYRPALNALQTKVFMKPVAVIVDQVYEYADFSMLRV